LPPPHTPPEARVLGEGEEKQIEERKGEADEEELQRWVRGPPKTSKRKNARYVSAMKRMPYLRARVVCW